MRESKSLALPLGYTPIFWSDRFCRSYIVSQTEKFVNANFALFSRIAFTRRQLARIGISAHLFEAVDLALTHSVKDAVLHAFIFALEAREQILHILALGGVILGTQARQNRQSSAPCKILNVLLGCIEKRTDQRYFSIREVGFW